MDKRAEGVERPDPPAFCIDQQPLSAIAGGLLKPPLMTFIIVNWNYGQFVGQTIDSVRGQDYPHFECLVVDNGSTDDSMEVIAKHVGDDVRFSIESLPENLGQLGAAVRALKRANGNFVCIVDSDDYLFPNFASCHIQVHLALPRSVAMTSSNVIEISEAGAMLTGGYSKFHESATLRKAIKGLRAAGSVPRLQTISEEEYLRLHQHTATPGPSRVGWLWAPGSSNVFRRSIMNRAIIEVPDGKLMRAADWHFNNVCHLLGGTALIDVPLSAYRHHGANFFSRAESIAGVRQGTKEYDEKSRAGTYQTLELLLRDVEGFGWQLGNRYWPAVLQADRPTGFQRYYRHRDIERIFTKHVNALCAFFGEQSTFDNLRVRYDVWATRRIFKRGLKKKGRLFWARFWLLELRRRMARRRAK